MVTCPNCGEIVMKGDPYCTHCGTVLRWYFDDGEEETPIERKGSKLYRAFEKMVNSDMTTDERFNFFKKYLFKPDYMLKEMREEIDYNERHYGCRFIMVYTATFPEVFIFLRQDRYRDILIFERCHLERSSGMFNSDAQEIHYAYAKLYDSPLFQSRVREIESGGYDFVEVSSDIGFSSGDTLEAKFTNGYLDVTYYIDDELNFERAFDSFHVDGLYSLDHDCSDKDLLLSEIRPVERTDRVKFMKAGSSNSVAFTKGDGTIVIYDYDYYGSSKLSKMIECSPDEFKRVYSYRYSLFK